LLKKLDALGQGRLRDVEIGCSQRDALALRNAQKIFELPQIHRMSYPRSSNPSASPERSYHAGGALPPNLATQGSRRRRLCPAASGSGVAIARALVFAPKVLLLHEPLSDLDDGRFNVDVSAFAGYAIGGQVSVIVPQGAAWAAPKEAASVTEALV
jgi:hypothetical protein